MSILEQICTDKKVHIQRKKAKTPLCVLEEKLEEPSLIPGFISALKTAKKDSSPALITEVKKASPSKGIIRENFDPVEIARTYEKAGAACLSVLTDTPYFQGHDEYFTAIRAAVSLPMLRKDFMIDPYQIYESRVLGADCILLIMACLSDAQTKELYDLSKTLGLDVLVEIHDENELNRALNLDVEMIGVNNRNLKTLNIDLQTGLDLAQKIPDNIFTVAESGISTSDDIQKFLTVGYGAFLVGESLMRQKNIGDAVKKLQKLN